MAAEVSSLLHIMADSKQKEISDRDETNRNLITRDFLGTYTVIQSNQLNPVVHRQLNDLNQQPLPDNSALDLKLLSSSFAPHHRLMNYQSVCTLDKVRSALERAGRESQSKRSNSPSTPSTSSSSSSSMIRGRSDYEGEAGEGKSTEGGYSSGMIAGGCPRCLMYVLISRGNPRCPRCDSHVPVALPVPVVVAKKPRLDLN